MSSGCFIGIDQGSSSTKAVAVDRNGRVLFQTRKALPPPRRDNILVEHDPADILGSVQDALAETLQAVAGQAGPLLAVGLSCQRSSCLAWSERTGEPLSPVISWRDLRGADLVASLAAHAPFIHSESGLPLSPYYSASKIRWLRDNGVGSGRDTVFGTLSSFLAQRLTGGARALVDHTNAARTQLMSVRELAWDTRLLRLFGLDGLRLPEIVPSGHAFGAIPVPGGGSVPLLACIGDQQSAMLGLGVIELGNGGINFGTGGFLMVNTGDRLLTAEGLMASVHWSLDDRRAYLIEGSVNSVGEALEWARSRLGLFSDYDQVDDLCWKAATDVTAFIGISGTGAPHWEAHISSAFHGLTAMSTSADMVRAVVEGIAFFMRDIAERIRAAGLAPSSFSLAGGLASISYLSQLQADLLGTDLRLHPAQEASALGAAYLAGIRHGTWSERDIRLIAAAGEIVQGEKNPGAERRYRKWQELHRMTGALDKSEERSTG